MARSKGRSGGGRRSGGGARTEAAQPVADEIEVVEEDGGMGIDDGIAFVTTVLLLGAFLCIDYARGAYHGSGLLFKGAYEAPADPDAGVAAVPAPDDEGDADDEGGE